MPIATIQSGDTLSALAKKHNTTVTALLEANRDNPSVKSANLIIAGGNINIPEGPAPSAGEETPAGAVSPPTPGEQERSRLTDFRNAMQAAINEGAQARASAGFERVSGALGDEFIPGTAGSIVSMIRASVSKSPELEQAEKALDEVIDQLRTSGKAPEVIGSAETGYWQWDSRQRDWVRISQIQAASTTGDSGLTVSSWTRLIESGQADISNVPSSIRNSVVDLLASNLPQPDNIEWVKEQWKSCITINSEQVCKNYLSSQGVSENNIEEITTSSIAKDTARTGVDTEDLVFNPKTGKFEQKTGLRVTGPGEAKDITVPTTDTFGDIQITQEDIDQFNKNISNL